MLEMGEVVRLIDRWEQAEHMIAGIRELGQELHPLLFHSSHSFIREIFLYRASYPI